jgi:hypothetical protein
MHVHIIIIVIKLLSWFDWLHVTLSERLHYQKVNIMKIVCMQIVEITIVSNHNYNNIYYG